MTTDQDRAALSIRTAADLLTTAAALVELDEKADALRHLKAVRDALHEAAEQGDNWGKVAATIDAVLAPTLAPGLKLGAEAFNAWQAQQAAELPAQHFTNSPDVWPPESWSKTAQQMKEEGHKTAEQWDAEAARARAERLN